MTLSSSWREFSDDGPKEVQGFKRAKKPKKRGKNTGDRDRQEDLVQRCLNAPKFEEPTPSEEEMQRRFQVGRNYNIGMFKQHNEENHDLACKLVMKKHALKMLPRNTKLKEEALKIDESAPPLWRRIAVLTPPIKDFDPSEFTEEDIVGAT